MINPVKELRQVNIHRNAASLPDNALNLFNRLLPISTWTESEAVVRESGIEDGGKNLGNGLPEDFPGKAEAKEQINISDKANCLLNALTTKLRRKLGEEALRRFIPYVQMYEFEGLLFSDPEAFAEGIDRPDLSDHFCGIRADYGTPEMINGSPHTAPSKRVKAVVYGYEKPLLGSLAALEVGLESIRAECQLFNQWLERLEALDAPM